MRGPPEPIDTVAGRLRMQCASQHNARAAVRTGCPSKITFWRIATTRKLVRSGIRGYAERETGAYLERARRGGHDRQTAQDTELRCSPAPVAQWRRDSNPRFTPRSAYGGTRDPYGRDRR